MMFSRKNPFFMHVIVVMNKHFVTFVVLDKDKESF